MTTNVTVNPPDPPAPLSGAGKRKYHLDPVTRIVSWLAPLPVTVVGIVLTVNSIHDEVWAVTPFGVFFSLAGLIGLVAFAGASRPIKLSPDSLTVPWAFGMTNIPIGEVAGVGLLFRYGRVGGWCLHVWRRDGTVEWTQFRHGPIPVRLTADGHKPPAVGMFGWDPLIHEDQERLRQTPLARTAWAVYTDVLALQGPDGPLATFALQRHPTMSRPAASPGAWWSPPNGDMGPADADASGDRRRGLFSH